MKMMKFISFDLDGTLVDPQFITSVWMYGVPKLYAQKEGIDFEKAKKFVINEYQRIGEMKAEWYSIKFWFSYFGINSDWKELLEKFKYEVKIYPEVPAVLEKLSERWELIVISNAAREFVDVEIEVTGIKNFFKHTLSATSDFGSVKKSAEFYLKVCNFLKVNPNEIVHVGDHREFDYLAPASIGIKTFYLNRDGREKKDSDLRNLNDFEKELAKIT
jgi:putative hydrolase of the HAD superfamily